MLKKCVKLNVIGTIYDVITIVIEGARRHAMRVRATVNCTFIINLFVIKVTG